MADAKHAPGPRKAVTFSVHHQTDGKGRTEHQIKHGNRIIARSADMVEIDRLWPKRAAIAKATGGQ